MKSITPTQIQQQTVNNNITWALTVKIFIYIYLKNLKTRTKIVT